MTNKKCLVKISLSKIIKNNYKLIWLKLENKTAKCILKLLNYNGKFVSIIVI